jgi:CDP-diacylglycerol--glycerol-3-phosphate 3-phosphatidyltransferase
MNLPNRLTLSRILLTVAFLVAMFQNFAFHETVALALFILASITDWMDGSIARSRKQITNFGILMDPLADKILMCSAFIAFVERQYVSAWMVAIIVARELAITGLRLLAAANQVVLAAERYGKHKTISQVTASISILVLGSYQQWGPVGRAVFGFRIAGCPWVDWFTAVAIWTTVILTFASGALYLWRNRSLYMQQL